jgi:hypothetical protein
MIAKNEGRREYNFLEIITLMVVTTFSTVTINYYYYDSINIKLKKLHQASDLMIKKESETRKEMI